MIIESLVSVVDKITQLLQHRETRQQQQFNDLVAAVYNDLHVVHTDYLQMFEECRHLLRNNAPFSGASEALMRERLNHEALRVRVRQLAFELQRTKSLDRYSDFYKAVAGYFRLKWIAVEEHSRSIRLLYELEAAAKAYPQESPTEPRPGETEKRAELLDGVNSILEELRDDWQAASTAYARALVASRR